MSHQVLRARSVSELIDATFSLYRRDASAYIMVTAMAVTPGLLVQLVIGGGGAIAPDQVAGRLFYGVVALVTYSLMLGVVIRMGSDVYLGGEADVQAAVRAVLPRLGSLIATAIFKGVMFFLHALLLFFPVLIAFAKYFAPEAAVVLEGKDAGDAMARSKDLSSGIRMHIFRTLLLGYGIYFLLFFALGFVAALFPNDVVFLFLSTAIEIVAYPTIALLTMLLYYDARIRKEGFDMEHLASTLGDDGRPALPTR